MNTAPLDNADAQTEHVNLNEVLHRFSTKAAWLAAERQTLPEAPRAQLEVLLREIGETVLPRCIDLKTKGQPIATLTVSNRRLFRFCLSGSPEKQITGNAADAKNLSSALIDLSKQATSMTSRALSDPAGTADSSNGCTVAALRNALAIDTRPCDISHLADLLEPHALAQMTWSGSPEKNVCTGADVWRPLMEAHAARLHAAIDGNAGGQIAGVRDTTGMAIPLSSDKVLVMACKGTLGVVSVTPVEDGLKAIGAWQIPDT